MLPLSALTAFSLQSIRLIATDMDGTLTQHGKFTPALLQAFSDLARVDIPVLIITGRSAGWMNGIVSYLPVLGAIAENGGLLYRNGTAKNGAAPDYLVALPDIIEHRQQLAHLFADLKRQFPQLQESLDNRFRLTDWTFEVEGLSLSDIHHLRDSCQAQGWGFTYSTVQCHIKPILQDKAIGLEEALKTYFPQYDRHHLLTVGDSPNDESLFNGDRFPLSIGVANVRHYADQMQHQPAYVTTQPEVEGFCELAQLLVRSRSQG